jgi:hypothetical protein
VVTERDVIHNCTIVLRQRGYWLKRNHVGKFRTPSDDWVIMGPPGIMDFIAVHETWPAFFIEFKRPREVLRETQLTKFEEIQFGFRLAAVMIDSAEELSDFLNGHESRARQRVLQTAA